MKKFYLIAIILLIITNLTAQKKIPLLQDGQNLAMNQKEFKENLRMNIGIFAELVFSSYETFVLSKAFTYDKLNNNPIRNYDIGVSKSLIEIYQKIYDTLAYRDIVLEPTALSLNHKWEKVYKLAYPYIDTLIKRYPNRNLYIPHYDYISASDSISKNKSWHAQDSLRARIRIGRMTGPNQFVFVEIGKNWYNEYTIEFSELTYSVTQTKSNQFMYKKNGAYLPLTTYLDAFYNSTPQIELNINVKFNDITTVFKGSFRSQPIKTKDMLPIAEFINKDKAYIYAYSPDDDYRKSYVAYDYRESLLKDGYKKAPNKKNYYRKVAPFNNNIPYFSSNEASILLIPGYFTKHDPTTFSWSMKSVIDRDKDLKYMFKYGNFPNYEDNITLNNYQLVPIGWFNYYNAYGLLTEKYFFSEYLTRSGSSLSGLYTIYDNIDSICIKKNQVYNLLDYMVDSVYIIDGLYISDNKKEHFDWVKMSLKGIIIYDTLALVYPFFDILSETHSRHYIGLDSMFLTYVNFNRNYNFPYREGTYKYSYSRLYKKSIKLYGLKPKTIYRVYPIYLKNYYEENPIKIIKR